MQGSISHLSKMVCGRGGYASLMPLCCGRGIIGKRIDVVLYFSKGRNLKPSMGSWAGGFLAERYHS